MNVKKYLMIVCCVLGVCLAALSGVIVASRVFEVPPGFTQGNPDLNLPKPSKSRANILVMGLDDSKTHTDTLMLVSLDTVDKKVNILSIPRDTRIVHEGQYDKINHLYSYKGKEENTIKAVTQVTGVPIHYYAIVDFKGFRNVIDILDGVEFDVPNISPGGGMKYTDPYQNLYIDLKAGPQTLNGQQAEWLVRFRSGYPDADLGRINMQQQFVKALIEQKLKPKYLTKALDIYKEIAENVVTNYTLADAASHLMTLRSLSADSIQTFQLPGHGSTAYTRYGYLSCYIYNVAETETIIEGNFKGSAKVNEPESAE
jgi:LCP family protein required for cell wall assembly